MQQHQEKIEALLLYREDMERDKAKKLAEMAEKERAPQMMAGKLRKAESTIDEM